MTFLSIITTCSKLTTPPSCVVQYLRRGSIRWGKTFQIVDPEGKMTGSPLALSIYETLAWVTL